MQESPGQWNISFAGCGFLMAYYCGVYCSLYQRAQFLFKGATKICGASSGALMGAVLACQISPVKCCENLLEMSREARKGIFGAVHPSFNLLKTVRNFLTQELPDDAHLLASGRLFVSLTRVSDGKNVLVSEFSSKEDLIQALICSCFYPLYCGVIPPSYHGIEEFDPIFICAPSYSLDASCLWYSSAQSIALFGWRCGCIQLLWCFGSLSCCITTFYPAERYIDGALSDNMPFSNLRNTITISPFSGESDIRPYRNPFYFHEIYYNNVSIDINFMNAHRVVIAFFPPEPEVLAEMCQNGYKDTLLFLKENDFLKQSALSELTNHIPPPVNSTNDNRRTGFSSCLLSESITKVFCKAGMRENKERRNTLSMKLLSRLLWHLCCFPLVIVYTVFLWFVEWTTVMRLNLLWMCKMTVRRTQRTAL